MEPTPSLYLIDGYNIIFRSYFAFLNNPLRNLQNENRSAVFGFFRTLSLIIRSYQPHHLLIAFDSIEPSFRHQLYDDYKATRDRAPEDLLTQIPIIEEFLQALGVPFVRVSGYEADDLIATVVRQCESKGQRCHIVTTDKDLLQLVSNNTTILRPKEGGFRIIDTEEIRASHGVDPVHIADFLALCGDSADNVPGVAGVGPKSATQLIQQFGDVHAIYAQLAAIKSSALRAKLESQHESALLSKQLVVLEHAVPLPTEIKEIAHELLKLKVEQVVPLFLRENMQSLAKEYRQLTGEEAGDPPSQLTNLQQRAYHYECIKDIASLKRWVTALRAMGRCALDSETDSLDPMQANPVGFSLCGEVGKACYIPLVGAPALLPADAVRQELRLLVEDPQVALIGQNIKYDYKVLKRWGLTPCNVAIDTMVAAWLLDSSSNQYSLDALAQRYLHYQPIPFPTEAKKSGFASLNLQEATDYAAEDADLTLELADLLVAELKQDRRLWELYCRVEMPLLPILAEMEYRGIGLDSDALAHYNEELKVSIKALEQQIYKESGVTFNIGSPKQLQKVLFEDLGLEPLKNKKTKTGYSTDNAVLTLLAGQHPLPQLVLDYRQLTKLHSTYVEALPLMINPTSGRVHTTFNIAGAATGRLSSVDPNLQNIPVKEEEGRKIRQAFIADSANFLYSADYSQIELVLLAHQSQDPLLLQSFREGRDIHQLTASLIFDVPPEQVSSAQRRIGKTINFGVMYGMSAFRLSRELRISRSEAQRFINNYFQTYTGVTAYIQKTLEEARRQGAVYTLLGRRRAVANINNRNKMVQQAAERVAVNSPIQGSAADIIKLAIIAIARRLQREKLKSQMLLAVHDEIILEGPQNEAPQIARILQEEMEGAYSLSLPLHVQVNYGTNWGALK